MKHNFKRTLALVLALVMALGCMSLSVWAEGKTVNIDVDGVQTAVYPVSEGFYQDGATYTASNNFYITNKAGLEYFRDLVNGVKTTVDAYTQSFTSWTSQQFYTNNIFISKTVHLLTDVELNNAEWDAIGYQHTSETDTHYANDKEVFYGNFHGHEHTISNLYIVSNAINKKNEYGLFGRFGASSNQTIKDITIENVSSSVSSSGGGLGAIAGSAGAGNGIVYFQNCKIIGSIQLDGSNMTGGLYGVGYGSVTSCTVHGSNDSYIKGYSAGALCGRERGKDGLSITKNLVQYIDIDNHYTSGPYATDASLGALFGTMADGASGTIPITDNDIKYVKINGNYASLETLYTVNTAATTTLTLNNNTVIPSFVAAIGETNYTTLAAAVAEAQSGDTVKL